MGYSITGFQAGKSKSPLISTTEMMKEEIKKKIMLTVNPFAISATKPCFP